MARNVANNNLKEAKKAKKDEFYTQLSDIEKEMRHPDEIGIKYLNSDGDFRSKECIELLKQADVIVTNPPFSLFREYVAQLVEYDKKFLIIGNVNAITYKEIFKLIKDNKLWLGASIHSGDREFGVPEDYPKYDNYDAINVDVTKDIPMDYSGAIGVPITF